MLAALTPGAYLDLEPMHTTSEWELWQGIRASDHTSVLLRVPGAEAGGVRTLARYHREYKLLRELDCASVARAIALHPDPTHPVLVLAQTQGGMPLRTLGVLAPEAAVGVCMGIANALEQLHASGVVHLALSSDNVMVAADGTVSLVGFDIAARLGDDGLAAERMHPTWLELATMAPEQTGRMNRSVGPGADLYALGVVLHELLSGELPLEAHDVIGWVHAHIAVPPRPLPPSVPSALRQVVAKLLEKAADDRYLSARSLAADLADVLERLRSGDDSPFEPAHDGVSGRFRLSPRRYGREADAERLRAAFERVATGGRELLLVSGWSGIGKTALVRETHRPLTERHGRFCMGKFDAFRRTPNSAVLQALAGLLDELREDATSELPRLLHTRIGPLLPVLVEALPQLERLVGRQPAPSVLLAGDAMQRFRTATRALLATLCGPERPLVLFLDDLQWADRSSLELMAELVSAPELSGLLLVGAYRDNEVAPGHQLVQLVHELEQKEQAVTRIELGPLSVEDLTAFVADSFGIEEPDRAAELGALLLEHTGGNPFFARRFLTTLARDGLLAFDLRRGRWAWSPDHIAARGPSDDVIALMVYELNRLPAAATHAVQHAALVGDSFGLAAVSELLGAPPAHTLEALLPAIRAGLCRVQSGWEWVHLGVQAADLVSRHADQVVLSFAHDRIRHAAVSLIDPDARPGLHLRIARSLRHLGPEHLFECTSHYRLARALLAEPEERAEVVELMLTSATKARASSAAYLALADAQMALELLGAHPWRNHPTQALRAHQLIAEANHLLGDFAEVEATCRAALENCEDRLSRARLHTQLMELSIHEGRFDDALRAMIEGLRLLGVDLGPHNVHDVASGVPQAIAAARSGRTADEIVEADEASDPEVLALLDHLGRASDTAFMNGRDWIVSVAGLAIRIALERGVAVSSSMAFTTYGLLDAEPHTQAGLRQRAEYGRIGTRLAERFGADDWRGRSNVSNAPHLEGSFHEAVRVFDRASRSAWEGSAVTWAGYSEIRTLFMMLVAGVPLPRLKQETSLRCARVRQANRMMSGVCAQALDAFIDALEAGGEEPWRLGGSQIIDAALTQELTAYGPWASCKLFGLQQLLAVIWQRWDVADAAGRAMEPSGHALLGMSHEHLFHVGRALTVAGRARKGSRAALDEIRSIEKVLVEYAACNDDYKPSLDLVRCARAQAEGDAYAALESAGRACAGAQGEHQGYVRGIANELAAAAAKTLGRDRLADAYRDDAIDAWTAWGALARARALSRSVGAPSKRSASMKLGDADSLLKACRVISGELNLEALLERQLELVMENAGAQHGMLVLDQDGAAVVAVEHRGGKTTLRRRALKAGQPSTVIVDEVRRTGRTIVIDDARLDRQWGFGDRPMPARPRSVLAVPIEAKGQHLGVFYLENQEATHVFAGVPQGALQVLVSQVAISLQNAYLYRELEVEVDVRSRTESQLRTERDDIAAILEHAPLLVCRVDRSGALTYVNPAVERATGRSEAQLLGSPWSVVFGSGEEHRPGLVHRLDSTFEGSDGERSVAWTCLRHEGDDELRFGDDTTERRRNEQRRSALEARLQSAQRLESIGTLASGIAHDFNNLLVPIVAYGAMLEEFIDDPIGEEFLGEIMKAGQRATQLVRRLLTAGRNAEPEMREVDLSNVIRDVVELLRASLPASVALHTELDAHETVLVDPSQVHQAILNLGVNAGHAMEDGGDLTFRSACVEIDADEAHRLGGRRGTYVRVDVVDTGHGMDEAMIGRIFDPFFTTKDIGRGTGLGLWVVHRATESCGGMVDVHSEPERGTRFSLWFPVGVPAARTATAEAPSGGREHVLLVDDEEKVLSAVTRQLQSKGYTVTACTTVADALEAVRQGGVDLVLSDYTMPSATGVELAAMMHEVRPGLAVVLSSGRGAPVEVSRLPQLGVAGFVMKPATATELGQVIRAALDERTGDP